MVGLHKSIRLSFLIVGHTKFSPDWCFGLLKQKFRKTSVNCLKDIEDVVDGSAVVNTSQLVGDQFGKVIVPTYDWADYLGVHFNKVPSIKAQHHFYFCHTKPGVVQVKQLVNSEELSYTIQIDKKWKPDWKNLPPILAPGGLSPERRWYLYHKVREFCSAETKDLVCPYPGPGPCPPSPSLPGPCPSRMSSPTPVSAGKKRRCGNCGGDGHNSRTCKKTKVNILTHI